jgi:hypothetical protein
MDRRHDVAKCTQAKTRMMKAQDKMEQEKETNLAKA